MSEVEMTNLDRFQSLRVAIGRQFRSGRRAVIAGATALTGYAPYVPKSLLMAPTDLRSADPMLAQEFYNGRFLLAGKLVLANGQSPFSIEETNRQWLRSLHSFEWLRHFSANNDPLSTAHATSLVKEWIETNGGIKKDIAWETEVTAKRLIAWLNHSHTILSVPDYNLHQSVMRSLGAHARMLVRHRMAADDGEPVLYACAALTYASLCFDGHASSLNFAADRLGQTLTEQVSADGAHVSRNPDVTADLLAVLLPLREGFRTAGKALPESVESAIERLLTGLRFFRLGDGNLARFNGATVGEIELLSVLRRYDEADSSQAINTRIGDYHRLQLGDTIALMDAGSPPRGELSRKAHAGCLSVEFSSGSECIVVNIGRPLNADIDKPAVWRSTAAHSTAVFYETSSCKFENSGGTGNMLGGQIFGGSLKAESSREDTPLGSTVTGHHLGYVREFGARHQRILTLDEDGNRLRGNDWFSGPDKGQLYYTTKDAVIIHFHLHPSCEPELLSGTSSVRIKTASGQKWLFSCEEVTPVVSDSIYYSSHTGAQRTKQIALHFNACKTPEINWTFKKK